MDYGRVQCTGLFIEEQDSGSVFRSFLSRIGMRGEFSRMRCFSYFKRKDELIGLLEWSHCSVV